MKNASACLYKVHLLESKWETHFFSSLEVIKVFSCAEMGFTKIDLLLNLIQLYSSACGSSSAG